MTRALDLLRPPDVDATRRWCYRCDAFTWWVPGPNGAARRCTGCVGAPERPEREASRDAESAESVPTGPTMPETSPRNPAGGTIAPRRGTRGRGRSPDPVRVLRALGLDVEPLDGERYRVSGGQSPHVVDTARRPWGCDCLDGLYRPGVVCKHRTAVYLHRQLDQRVREALRQLVQPEAVR